MVVVVTLSRLQMSFHTMSLRKMSRRCLHTSCKSGGGAGAQRSELSDTLKLRMVVSKCSSQRNKGGAAAAAALALARRF